jgi:transposase-like protein
MTTGSTGPDQTPNGTPAKAKRRRYSEAYRLRILEEADRCSKGELGLLLRREGLYSSHLASWRRWRRRAHPEHPESKKAPTESQLRHELARTRRENARLQLKLEHAEKLLALQKKLADMMEAIEPAGENEGSSA